MMDLRIEDWRNRVTAELSILHTKGTRGEKRWGWSLKEEKDHQQRWKGSRMGDPSVWITGGCVLPEEALWGKGKKQWACVVGFIKSLCHSVSDIDTLLHFHLTFAIRKQYYTAQ